MKKRSLFALSAVFLCLISFSLHGKEQKNSYGVVSFPSCMSESKYGKYEQESFEKMREQLSTLMNDTGKKLKEVRGQLDDPDFVESRSPEALAELEARRDSLQEEVGQIQGQYFQVMQQAQHRVAESMNSHIQKASEAVRKKMSLPLIVREEACFSFEPSLDVTKSVIEEMDSNFDKENKVESKVAAPTN